MCKSSVKTYGLAVSLRLKLHFLSIGEENGIPGVAVKCVDIWKNTGCEGCFLS